MSAPGVSVQDMTAVALITDSSACLPARPPVVDVVPVVIHLPDGDVVGDAPAAVDRVYEALRRREPVKSSAPSAVEYLAAIEEAPADDIVVITPAEEFTTMYRNACVAAELAAERVAVVDSRTAAAAHGLVVEEAAEAAAAELGGMLGVEEGTEFSPSMGIHTGPGVVGVAWLRPSIERSGEHLP